MNKNLVFFYNRVYLEMLVICLLSLTIMIASIVWSYQNYNDNTRNSFAQYRGRTIPIFDNTKELRKQKIKYPQKLR
jgi:hypothetical protein